MRFALLAALVPSLALAQLPPQKALESLQVADGLQVELFANEPDVINPTSIDVDHLGRVWVCEAVNYRCHLRRVPLNRPEGDRIVILTDKDGDGKADESKVFYQSKEIYGPLGVAVAPIANGKAPGSCKVFVCQSPDILLFEDLDGDGKADGPPKKFLMNFGGVDHDHGVHGINIGPDGKLYFTVGDSGVRGIQSSDGKGRKWVSNNTDCRAGTVWRCDMDGKNLELIAHNFRNNYECCVNSFGEIWLSDNDDDGNQQTRICHVMPGGDYGYNPRGPGQTHWHEEQPGIVHKVLRTGFGSPTGICFYEGSLLPKKYHGQLLHTDAGPRELRAFHIKPKGAGYEATQENLVTSSDNWFRLSDVCVAPDGSVFIADWYDPGVGGHGMGDWTRGRIYRVTPKGHKGYKVPKVDVSADDKGLMHALASPNLAVRYMAIGRIRSWERDDGNGMSLAQGAGLYRAGDKSLTEYEHHKVTSRAIILGGEMGLCEDLIRQEATRRFGFFGFTPKDRDDAATQISIARVFATRFAQWKGLSKETIVLLFKDIDKAPVAISRELLLWLRNADASIAADYIVKLAKLYDGQDRFYLSALNIACGSDPKRRDAILADFEKHFPEWNDKVADLVWELRPKSMLPKMEKLLGDAALTAKQKGRIIDILAGNDDAAAGKTMLNLISGDYPAEVKSRAIDNLKLFLPTKWNALSQSEEFRAVLKDLLTDKATRLTGIRLAAAAKYLPATANMAVMAGDGKEEVAIRVEAVRALGQLRSAQAVGLLEGMLADPVLAKDAVGALAAQIADRGGSRADDPALKALQRVVTGFANNDLKSAALSALAGSQAGSQWIISQHEKNLFSEAQSAEAGRLLRNSPFQPVRNKALLLFPPPGKLDLAKLPSIATLAKRQGDASHGKQILAASLKNEAQCLKCHSVKGVGGSIGPDLSMIGKKASRENLIESILQPSKAIADQFLQYQVETKTGQQIMGLVVEQDADKIVLRDANGKDHPFVKRDLESIQKSQVSIMPMDIVKALSEDELIDVVEYMLTLKTPSLTPDAWQVVGPFPVANMAEGVDKAFDVEKFGYDRLDTFTEKGQRKAVTAGFQGNLRWQSVRIESSGYLDLAKLFGDKATNSVSYAYREIESSVDQDATILLGSDDGGKVWVNGAEVWVGKETRAAAPEQHRVAVKLKKGINKLLVKIANGGNPHGLYLTIEGGEELKAR